MITVITLCRNEQYLAPFFLRHYAFADWIVVFDNQSTDGTRAILQADKRVHIINYDSGGVLDDLFHLKIKNEAYKEMSGDWFIIVDFDEFVDHPDLPAYLDRCAYDGVTLPSVDGWSMIGDDVPMDDGRPMTEHIFKGVRDQYYNKRVIVHRDVDVRYSIGCHSCDPRGRFSLYSERPTNPTNSDKSGATTSISHRYAAAEKSDAIAPKLLHYNWLSREHGLAKRRRTSEALSASNLEYGYGLQCFDLEGEGRWYDEARARRVDAIAPPPQVQAQRPA